MGIGSWAVSLVAALAAAGCAHTMEVTNLHEYRVVPAAPTWPPRTAGVTSRSAADPETRGYVDAIADALRRDHSFQQILYPAGERDAQLVDVLFDVSVSATYAGSGWNFVVNWPGYLIFAPAIFGYGYEAAIDTRVSVRSRDGAWRELRIPAVFRFRHAELDRTWTEVGWLELGIVPFVGGILFTRYDPDVTPELVGRIAVVYGAYVAQRMREASPAAPPPGAAPPAERGPPQAPARSP